MIAPLNIWIIEDDLLFRSTIKKMLSKESNVAEILTFENCEDALSVLENGETAHVVFMDIGLPGMSGLEGIKQVKARSPNTFIIVLTVHEDNDKIFAAICNGASGYLLKPSSRDQIVQSLASAQQGGAPMNPQVASKVLHMFTELAPAQQDYGLTAREREVLQLLAEDKNKRLIADQLHLSYHTIDMHVRNIYSKLHVHTATGAIAKAIKARII